MIFHALQLLLASIKKLCIPILWISLKPSDSCGDSSFNSSYFAVNQLDALVEMEKAMKRDNIHVNDRQLACAHISSREGQNYLKAMAAAANYAWVNRSSMTFLTRQVNNNV